MSVIVKHIPHTVDLNEPIKKTYIDTLLATEDNLAHCFNITLNRGGEAVTLPDGAAVTAYFIRYSDNATITLKDCSVSDNMAVVKLGKSCYNRAGQFAVIVKVNDNGVTNTVFYGEGTIFTSVTDTIVDDENIIPSLSDLLAQIDAMEKATEAAKTATENADTAASNANAKAEAAQTAATNANNAAAKIDGMTVSATEAEEAGVTVSEVDGVKHIAFELPKGDKGDKGDPGSIENVTIESINGLPEALGSLSQQKADKAGWTPNKIIGTDADGNLVVQDQPEGGGGDADTLGGVAAAEYARKILISDVYDASNAYNSGDYCIYDNALRKCKQDNVMGIEPTDTTYWEEVTIADEITANERLRQLDSISVNDTNVTTNNITQLLARACSVIAGKKNAAGITNQRKIGLFSCSLADGTQTGFYYSHVGTSIYSFKICDVASASLSVYFTTDAGSTWSKS